MSYIERERVFEILARNNIMGCPERNAGLLMAARAIADISAADVIYEENILKFYYVRSTDDYWIGLRVDNFYYAEFDPEVFQWTWTHSRYLPWGRHVVSPSSLWKEHTYPSKPEEIPFGEWLRGFIKKYFTAADVRPVVLCKDCRHRDPEDRKCDCGGREQQGCPFPVHDDYFYAYGEKREEKLIYDELVKRLREADEKSMCSDCGLNLHTGATKKGVLFAEAADAIEELSKRRWIPVKE